MTFFTEHWRGRRRLWSAYWILGVFGQIVVLALFCGVFALIDASSLLGDTARRVFVISGLLAMLAWQAFAGVCVWRCADNVQWVPWSFIARTIVLLGAFNTLTRMFEFAASMHR